LAELLMKVISIVPRLPPSIDGVGDYALRLAQQLYQDHGLSTHFIVADPDWTGQIDSPGISADRVSAHSADALLALLTKHSQTSPTTVLLQFSGYGYAKRSCCFWLVEGLARWKHNTTKARLITMFHEVYSAFGMPWRHHFWVTPMQRYLSARLMQISDSVLTNAELHAKMLYGLCPETKCSIAIFPVLSGIGEPQAILKLSERQKHLVIFGQAGSRIQVYRNAQRMIGEVCHRLEIEQILDIGQPTGMDLQTIGDVPLLEKGRLSAIEISQILQTSIAGLLNYDANRLAKSSVFAAYCAHGLLPINANGTTSQQDGIAPGKHYWIVDEANASPNLVKLQKIASNAESWYKNHNLRAQSRIFAQVLDVPHQPDEISIA
jgi:hypothetical protein